MKSCRLLSKDLAVLMSFEENDLVYRAEKLLLFDEANATSDATLESADAVLRN